MNRELNLAFRVKYTVFQIQPQKELRKSGDLSLLWMLLFYLSELSLFLSLPCFNLFSWLSPRLDAVDVYQIFKLSIFSIRFELCSIFSSWVIQQNDLKKKKNYS